MQHLALEMFYCDFMTGGRINRFGGPWPTPTPIDEFISQLRTPYRDRAEALRAEAKMISEIDRGIEDCPREIGQA